jgi:NADPH:quinone reductase-like Zn-dependent oxidoreductase
MKAAVYTRYGPPEVVGIEDVPNPLPGADELLVRVRAATVNRTDSGVRQADPFLRAGRRHVRRAMPALRALRRAGLRRGQKILVNGASGSIGSATRQDFTRDAERYDVVFDAVGKSSFRRCRRLLEPHGVFLFTDLGFLWHVPFLALLTRFAGKRRVMLPIPRPRQPDVEFLKGLIEGGEFTAVIDRRCPLDEIVDAYRYVDTGQKTGNVVITVA